jgi:hypothetical protein
MKWRQKSFHCFCCKKKKVCIEVCDLTHECKEQKKHGLFDYLDDSSIPIMPIVCQHDFLLFKLSFLLLSNSTIPMDMCFFCCLRALNCSLAWIHYGAHGLIEKSSFLPSFIPHCKSNSLFVCVCVCFCEWNSLLSRFFVIRITNLCDSGTFWETLGVSPTPLQGIGFSRSFWIVVKCFLSLSK